MSENSKGKVVIAANLQKKSSFVTKEGRELSKEEVVGKRKPLRDGVQQMGNGVTRKSTVL